MAVSLGSALNRDDTLPYSAQESGQKIVAYGVSADSAYAIKDINAAMKQNGIEGQIAVPNGCWNIVWMILDKPADPNTQSVAVATTQDSDEYVDTYAAVSSFSAEESANYQVFWFAINYQESIDPVHIFDPDDYGGVMSILDMGRDITFYLINQTGQIWNLSEYEAKSERLILSILEFENANGEITYTSSSGLPYNVREFQIFDPNMYYNILVPAKQEIVPSDVLIGRQPGYIFKGYEGITNYIAPDVSEVKQLVPVFEVDTRHNIIVSEESSLFGTVTTVPEGQAAAGVEVKISIVPKTGYIVDSVTATYGEASAPVEPIVGKGNNWSFVMPDGDVTITVKYIQVYSVRVDITNSDFGSATASPNTNVTPGELVTLTINPNPGYKANITATYGAGNELTLTGEGNPKTFEMPEGDVTITVTFSELEQYNIEINPDIKNGSISAEPNPAYPGQEVTLSIKPDQGYFLKSIYYYIKANESIHHEPRSAGVTKMIFDMPEGDVVVNATFEKAERITVVNAAIITDRPGNNWTVDKYEPYNGTHYDDSNVTDAANPVVKNYSISNPVTVSDSNGEYTRYTLTANDLRLAAHVSAEELDANKDKVTATYGYWIGVTLSPCDGGSQNYTLVQYSQNAATSRDKLVVMAEDAWLSYSNPKPITIYIQLDPQNLQKEYWVAVSWGKRSDLTSSREYICLSLEDVNCKPITHTYLPPDNLPAGFSGNSISKTSYGEFIKEGNNGFKTILTPTDLGWTIPESWKWHWEMENGQAVASTVNDLSNLEKNGFAHFYDHTFKLVIDNIPPKRVNISNMTDGTITLSQGTTIFSEPYSFNRGSTVTVKPQGSDGKELSQLFVNENEVTAQTKEDGSYDLYITDDDTPITIKATFIERDKNVNGVTVKGIKASHDENKQWSITLPYNETLPTDSEIAKIVFNCKASNSAVFDKSEVTTVSQEQIKEAKKYIFKIGEETYTIVIKIASPKVFNLAANILNQKFDVKYPETVTEGQDIILEIVPGFGYVLPSAVTVKVGGVTVHGYNYDKETGKLIVPGNLVTGDVTVEGTCGNGSVDILVKADNPDVKYSENGIDTLNPTKVVTMPRLPNTGLQHYDLPAVLRDKSDIDGGGNQFGWEIPEWLNFLGWFVNENADGKAVTDVSQYTQLKDDDNNGIISYQPKFSNPNPIIIAKWGEPAETFEVKVRVLPGGNNDVYYASDSPEFAGELVTADNASIITSKALAKVGKTISISLYANYVRDGYRASGWSTTSGDTIDGIIYLAYQEGVTPSLTEIDVQIEWSKNNAVIEGSIPVHAVFKHGEGGLGADYETDLVILPESMSTADIALPTPDMAGFTLAGDYSFAGWKLEQDGKVYSEGIDRVTLLKYQSSVLTFTAQWAAAEAVDINYTVSPGELSNQTGADVKQETLAADANPRTVKLPTTTAGVAEQFNWDTTGYEFLGWESSDDRIDLSFEFGAVETAPFRPIEGMTITALWGKVENVETWTVSFESGEGTGTMAPIQKRIDTTSKDSWTIEVPACTFTAPEGKVFSHWTVNGKRVSTSTYKVETKDTVFTAMWKDTPDTVISIYFRANGGSGSMQTAEVCIPWNEEGTTYRLPACTITPPSGHVFAGWKYGNSVLSAGAVITVTKANESIELVAQWQPQCSVPSNPGTGSGGGSGSGSGGTGTGSGSGNGTGTGDGTGTSTEGNPVITPEPDDQPMHGEVSSNVQSAAVGDEVTVLPAPDSKYMTGKVIVKDKDGNEVDVTWNGDGTYSFEMPEGGVTITAEFVTPDEVYEDVEPTDWYLEGVAKVANYGLMNGVNDSDFGPNLTATRAQLMTILARRSHVYGDTSSGEEWYKAGMDWAVREGISDGTRPNEPLTRQEIIVMLYQYVGSPKVSGTKFAEFTDSNTVASWALDAMKWAVEVGIIHGTGNNTLAPAATATRAELAIILTNVMNTVEEF